ncbi:MAG: hypothetical protein L0G64_10925, partial [Acinetobacter sp.]|uniref:hypothetical protein n=1 Tax=Acinetobacter sp. TaxID=472 RepID=UPI002647BEB7
FPIALFIFFQKIIEVPSFCVVNFFYKFVIKKNLVAAINLKLLRIREAAIRCPDIAYTEHFSRH